jgi:hypothetical protein
MSRSLGSRWLLGCPRRSRLATWGSAWLILAALFVGAGCQGNVQPPPAAPEDPSLPPVKLDLPAPPRIVKIALPTAYPDGTMSVYGLRHDLDSLLNKEVLVRGVVEELYVCPWAEQDKKEHAAAEAARKAGRPVPKSDDSRPACKVPHFFLSDPQGGKQRLLVVGYDTEDEKTGIKEPIKGQAVVLTGTLAKDSPEGFIAVEGLLLLKSWASAEPGAEPVKK